MADVKNLFITGRPGIGKTTVLLKAIEHIPIRVHGFTTCEVRQGRSRVGFRIEDTEGAAALMAHVDFTGPVRVGKYGVDVSAVERIGAQALRTALAERTPAVIDEVGKMELACPAFFSTLMEVLDADIPVLGTMHSRTDSVTTGIRARPDTLVTTVTAANRDLLPQRLAEMLMEAWRRTPG
jgi:nucleoside-triphosphatase